MYRFRHASTAIRLDVIGLILAGFINTFLASFVASVILGAGTPTLQPDIVERILWINENSLVWQLGWLFWFAVTLSFSWSYYALGRNLGGVQTWVHLAIGLAIIAAAVDILGIIVNMAVLPGLADAYVLNQDTFLVSVFQSQESLSTALTNVTAFGIYTFAGLLLLPACFHTPSYPRWIAWLGTVEWGIATIATVLLIILPTLATIPLLISFVLYAPWVWASAWWILRDTKPVDQ